MQILLLSFALAMLVWAGIVMLRGSIFLSTALFLVSTSCFPAEFFSVNLGGLTWTLDRIWFMVLVAQCVINWNRRELKFMRLEYCDVAVGLFMLWIIARTITQPWGTVLPEQPHTLMHLINGYLIPFTLYFVLRVTNLDIKQLKQGWIVLAILGTYLSVTAILEIAHVWSLVFPKFIADPSLGIHFGRARGPMLQSVRLGICLIATWLVFTIFTVWIKPHCRYRWALFTVLTPLFWGALFLTYTRSVWLGLGVSICTLVLLALQGLPRRAAIFAMLSGCLAIGILKGPDLIAFKREYSAAETRESTYMRAAFAYVSIEMFKERPVAGYGFNQFQVYNRPFLSDRSTDIRLNSIRGYVHHNGYLSLLVDLGVVGSFLFAFVVFSMSAQAWSLWHANAIPKWARGFAMLFSAVGLTHLLQMAFHELSFSPIENSFLFAACGLVVAAKQQYCIRQDSGKRGEDGPPVKIESSPKIDDSSRTAEV